MLSIDASDAEGRYLLEPAHEQTAERLFERDWALALLEGVLAGLRAEYERSGRGAVFEVAEGRVDRRGDGLSPRPSWPAGSAPPRPPSRLPSTGFGSATATRSARRLPPRSPTRPRSKTSFATCSPPWDAEAIPRKFSGPCMVRPRIR